MVGETVGKELGACVGLGAIVGWRVGMKVGVAVVLSGARCKVSVNVGMGVGEPTGPLGDGTSDPISGPNTLNVGAPSPGNEPSSPPQYRSSIGRPQHRPNLRRQLHRTVHDLGRSRLSGSVLWSRSIVTGRPVED
mmetsp:Transcript_34007/g.54756  ORF Transcript_34007/g.54756 Transcript_34007/m.54756 type:complete len:135 (-) Transcript_34007:1959-2363(-)